MNRQDLIKTFQTSFGPQCGAEKLPHRAHLTPWWSEAGGLLYPLKGEPTNHCNAFSRGLSRRLCFPLPFSLPLATFVVKNSSDAVCIASSRMSPLKADCVGNSSFRRPEGIDGAPSVCRGALRGFDVCVRSGCYRHAWRLNETHRWLSARPQTVTPVSLTAVRVLPPKERLQNVWIGVVLGLLTCCCCGTLCCMYC